MESFLKSNHAAQQTLEEKGQTYLFLRYEQECMLLLLGLIMIYVGVRHYCPGQGWIPFRRISGERFWTSSSPWQCPTCIWTWTVCISIKRCIVDSLWYWRTLPNEKGIPNSIPFLAQDLEVNDQIFQTLMKNYESSGVVSQLIRRFHQGPRGSEM